MQLGRPRRLAHPQIDPPARQQIERRHPLGDALRLVGGELDDAMPQPDALGALAGRAEEHLGGGAMRILLEEMVLDHPDVVVAKPVGELHLSERLLEQVVLAARGPRTRQLQFVEDAELHDATPTDDASAIIRRRQPPRKAGARSLSEQRVVRSRPACQKRHRLPDDQALEVLGRLMRGEGGLVGE